MEGGVVPGLGATSGSLECTHGAAPCQLERVIFEDPALCALVAEVASLYCGSQFVPEAVGTPEDFRYEALKADSSVKVVKVSGHTSRCCEMFPQLFVKRLEELRRSSATEKNVCCIWPPAQSVFLSPCTTF